MKAPANVQIITQNGDPAFVVIPYDDYVKIFPEKIKLKGGQKLPRAVANLAAKNRFSLARAWREYLKLTQKEVAKKMGITQAALSQMESGKRKLRQASLDKLAAALGIKVDQLRRQ